MTPLPLLLQTSATRVTAPGTAKEDPQTPLVLPPKSHCGPDIPTKQGR